ncbi:hypothetical protein [Adlercreutzia mucosicola]|uniref:hypothetical protein n=1 Tax=Adlercreutzia mucosicola TaxID=580026 RepID=UPI002B247FD7|nr:hypothetical protein [Adlercreutzia mucosicola]MEB1815037.1 hypothetical protein [Adlercreutzia mucosicola]
MDERELGGADGNAGGDFKECPSRQKGSELVGPDMLGGVAPLFGLSEDVEGVSSCGAGPPFLQRSLETGPLDVLDHCAHGCLGVGGAGERAEAPQAGGGEMSGVSWAQIMELSQGQRMIARPLPEKF